MSNKKKLKENQEDLVFDIGDCIVKAKSRLTHIRKKYIELEKEEEIINKFLKSVMS